MSDILKGFGFAEDQKLTVEINAILESIKASLNKKGMDVFTGTANAEYMNGGSGDDIANYAFSFSGVGLSLGGNGDASHGGLGVGTAGFAAGDTYNSIKAVVGSYAFSDTITGSFGSDVLVGLGGNDVLNGGGGNDTIDGGVGADAIDGGSGVDTVSYLSARSGIKVSLATNKGYKGDAAGDQLNSIAGVIGSTHNDEIIGGKSTGVLSGGLGNDTIKGGKGKQVLDGGAGKDKLYAGSGDQVLDGGVGSDSLYGGSGHNAFRFDTAIGKDIDTIHNFEHGKDAIYLEASIFKGLALGQLRADYFHIGAVAADANDLINYDMTTGNLIYDRDGNGGAAGTVFAYINDKAELSALDFLVV